MLWKHQGEVGSVAAILEAPRSLSSANTYGPTRPSLSGWIERKGRRAVEQMLTLRMARGEGNGDDEGRLEVTGGDGLSLSGAEKMKNGHDVFIVTAIQPDAGQRGVSRAGLIATGDG